MESVLLSDFFRPEAERTERTEEERLQHVKKQLKRALPDYTTVAVILVTNLSDNALLYEHNRGEGLSLADMYTARWLYLEPRDVDRAVASGNAARRVPLAEFEKPHLDICVEAGADGAHIARMANENMRHRQFMVGVTTMRGKTFTRVVGVVGGVNAALEAVYVEFLHGSPLPRVAAIRLYGTRMDNGEEVVETIAIPVA